MGEWFEHFHQRRCMNDQLAHEKSSKSLAISEMQIKSKMKYHYTPS